MRVYGVQREETAAYADLIQQLNTNVGCAELAVALSFRQKPKPDANQDKTPIAPTRFIASRPIVSEARLLRQQDRVPA